MTVVVVLLCVASAVAATNGITTVVGERGAGFAGDGGPARDGKVSFPVDVTVMPDGGYLIADQVNHRVRRVAPDGTISTVAGSATAGSGGDGGPATSATLNAPSGTGILSDGSILIADANNNRVRKVAPNGTISTVAGTGAAGFFGDDGAATSATLSFPFDIAVAPDDSYLIADLDNHRVRRVSPAGIITTFAGTATAGLDGDGGAAKDAQLNKPAGVAFTADGGVLIADSGNHRVRRVQPGGTISTAAGDGFARFGGDGNPATAASLNTPTRVAVAPDGAFLIADRLNHRVRRVSSSNVISTIAGKGTAGSTGDGGPATQAQLNEPLGVAATAGNDALVADTFNHRIRLVDDGDPPGGPEPPPLPEPPPPREHTLLGTITYEPAFGVGYRGLGALGPFAAPLPPQSVTVTLRGGDGGVVAERSLARPRGEERGEGDPTAPISYRFDGLGPCGACSVVLAAASTVQDVRPVSFGGEAGQTDADLVYGRTTQAGAVEGSVLVPFGANPRDLDVAILDSGGRVLAETSRARSCGDDGGPCGSRSSYDYRLTGLPLAATPVRAVLKQAKEGQGRRQPVEVDSAEFTLDPSGVTTAPDLTGIADPPAAAKGRTLYGQINFRAPFAPGARKASDLDVPNRELKDLTVELRGPDGAVRERLRKFRLTSLGYTGYQFQRLEACAECTLRLLDGKRVVSRVQVTIPDVAPSVTRRDLNFSDAGEPEFVAGAISAGDTRARRLKVVVTDAVTGEQLASSAEGDRACSSDGTRCPTGDTMLYRLGGVPPEREVVLTLQVAGRASDSRRIRTAPEDEVTQAPTLVVPYGRGPRSLQGTVVNAGPFGPGGEPRERARRTVLTARLLDENQDEVRRAPVRPPDVADGTGRSNTFTLDDLPACESCTLELLRADGTVDDRVPVGVRADSPSVTVADLRWQALTGGAYVQGDVVLRGRTVPKELSVRVLTSDGKVLADSSRVGRGGDGGEQPGKRLAYRLGGIPRDAGRVRVVVLTRNKRLASTTVTLAPGTADTMVPDLRVDPPGRDGR